MFTSQAPQCSYEKVVNFHSFLSRFFMFFLKIKVRLMSREHEHDRRCALIFFTISIIVIVQLNNLPSHVAFRLLIFSSVFKRLMCMLSWFFSFFSGVQGCIFSIFISFADLFLFLNHSHMFFFYLFQSHSLARATLTCLCKRQNCQRMFALNFDRDNRTLSFF